MKTRELSRRFVLRGAGAVAIGLPLLPELLPRARAGADDGIPHRLFTLSFGLGIEEALQDERFDGPLQSLRPFETKAAFFTNLDANPLLGDGTPHFRATAALFTGVPQSGDPDYHAGGPSMEQVFKRALHPSGVPNVSVPEISVGLWSRTGAVSQFTRQWNPDGSPAQRPERRPTRIFELLFGGYMPPDGGSETDAELIARNHTHRSVLDTVMEQYRGIVGPNSPLGAESKARVHNHLAALRDVELQLAPKDPGLPPDGPTLTCEPPADGTISDPAGHSFYDAANGATGAGAPVIDWEVARDTMKLIGELVALGVACDAVRFGSLVFVGGGGHVRFANPYSALGQTLDFTSMFDDTTPHDGIFHDYDLPSVRVYQHFCIAQLVHMLAKMDEIEEPNGKTVLDNSLVLLGTEYGKNHDADHVFHAVLGGGGRFDPGWYDQPLVTSHVYHEALAAYGVDSGIPGRWADFEPTEISGFRNQ